MSKLKDRQRKWKLALLSILLITLGFTMTILAPVLATAYGTFVGAILALNGIYGGANVASKRLVSSNSRE